MKYLASILTICCLLTGCSKKESDILSLGLLVDNPSHEVVVWLNGDPVKVFTAGYGGPIPLRMVAQSGENNVWVTVENRSEHEDQVVVDIKEGSWFEPEKIKEHYHWETSKSLDKSPSFNFTHGFALGTDRRVLEEISISKEEALTLIKEHYGIAENALKNRDLTLIGFDRDSLNEYMGKIMQIPDFYEQVFEADDYEFERLSSPEDLDVVVGKTSILGYSRNGGGLFRAGPLNRNSQGEMVYSFSAKSISLGKIDGEWTFIY
jgi:mRNA-degrading endonuclease HigB of HigAB toxin-antitoxin module